MKVILKEDVQNLGQQGDVVEVKPGFARNYLMPQKLAILFTKQQKKELSDLLKIIFPDTLEPGDAGYVPGPFLSVIRGIMLKLLTGQPLTFLERQILKLLNVDLNGLIPDIEDALNDLFDDLPDDP